MRPFDVSRAPDTKPVPSYLLITGKLATDREREGTLSQTLDTRLIILEPTFRTESGSDQLGVKFKAQNSTVRFQTKFRKL